jgi:hypothetical protein
MIRPDFSRENIINTFWASANATTIVEVEGYCPNRYTPIDSVGMKKGKSRMAPLLELCIVNLFSHHR